jgi:D-alanyl-D-alanine carboxypeptidase (penicillin-binding protein 5/6)
MLVLLVACGAAGADAPCAAASPAATSSSDAPGTNRIETFSTLAASPGPGNAATVPATTGPATTGPATTVLASTGPATTAPSTAAAAGAGQSAVVGGARLATKGLVVDYGGARAPRLPDITASSFVVADAGTGAVLAAKDPHGQFLPASTLKLLTAVSLMPVLKPGAATVATALAASAEPNDAGLVAGQQYTNDSLFTALLTISANDAAVALAQAAGGYARGIGLMNATAARLHANDTHAVDPNGLDAPGQYTSAYDLALIARQALASPEFLHYDQIRSAPFTVKPGKSETLVNQNTLLSAFPGALGGKVGWTTAAGATYVGLARRGGVTLIVTLMHCPALSEITAAEKLLTWGFGADGKVAPAGTLVAPAAAAAGAPGAATGSGGPAAGAAGAAAAASGSVSGDSAAGGAPVPTIVAASFTGVTFVVIVMAIITTRRQRARGHTRSGR